MEALVEVVVAVGGRREEGKQPVGGEIVIAIAIAIAIVRMVGGGAIMGKRVVATGMAAEGTLHQQLQQ